MIRDSMVPVEINVRREMFRQVALATAVLLALCGLCGLAILELLLP